MAHEYYCTFCGGLVNQNTVLFDMMPVLILDEEKPLSILSLLLTRAELNELYTSGTPSTAGYQKCSISLQKMMVWISNSNNLNDPEIGKLTAQDIISYLSPPSNEVSPEKDPKKVNDKVFKEPATEEKASSSAKSAGNKSAAILALQSKDTTNDSMVNTEARLRFELSILKNLFIGVNGGNITEKEHVFELRLNFEDDDMGGKVLTGYYLRYNFREHLLQHSRVCPNPLCKNRIFDHAGVAEHKLISFIGDEDAGKTCTIVALTHYAQNAINPHMVRNGTIWEKVAGIKSVSSIQLVSPDKQLKEDLDWYAKGVAPQKNKKWNRNDTYSATFMIENEEQPGKKYLLSLVDLPGELNNPDGSVDNDLILNHFPIGLACDAFVLCFDSMRNPDRSVAEKISNVCSWGDQYQQLRAQRRLSTAGEAGFAPVLVLFTKDEDLEGERSLPRTAERNILDRIARTYYFDDERDEIDRNEVYKSVSETIRRYQSLKKVYLARLRCSPFGFAAPDKTKIKDGTATNLDENGKVRLPSPINVEKLMRWLLVVSGCIPTDAVYCPSVENSYIRFNPENNFLTRPQYRPQRPAGQGKDGDVLEALSRCYLFENPGYWDQEFLRYYDKKSLLAAARVRAKFKPEND